MTTCSSWTLHGQALAAAVADFAELAGGEAPALFGLLLQPIMYLVLFTSGPPLSERAQLSSAVRSR